MTILNAKKLVLAIESSCDETAVAILDLNKKVLVQRLFSQDHSAYQGVMPEAASRYHIDNLQHLVEGALKEIGGSQNIEYIAATAGPGLIGGLLVGTCLAKAMAFALEKKFLAINHLEGHLLISDIQFPFLALIISGGHTEFIITKGVREYHKIGSTLDDAVGETFDKVARMLGLAYPGGPEIEKLAAHGNENAYQMPTPLYHSHCCNFSFSGLKTHVRALIGQTILNDQMKRDIAASFQKTIGKILVRKIGFALKLFQEQSPTSLKLMISGGVAANSYLREKIIRSFPEITIVFPQKDLCTDNAIMIACAAIDLINKDLAEKGGVRDDQNFAPDPNWELEALSFSPLNC